jgi:hypothetical protein
VAGTTAVGNTFETLNGVEATGAVGTVTITGIANVSVTGVVGTTAIGRVTETILPTWGEIIPDQNASYSTVTPSQTPSYSTITPSQDPSWLDKAA